MIASAGKWQRLAHEHLDAVAQFVARARTVAPGRWSLPSAPGRWSPAQVTEHVVLAYEALLRELSGAAAMRLRTKCWLRILLKRLLLPRILRTGRFPAGAIAPRELRPASPGPDREELLERLGAGSRRLESELVARKSARLTHPYFGRLRAAEVLRFCTIHTAHHAKQLRETLDVAVRPRREGLAPFEGNETTYPLDRLLASP